MTKKPTVEELADLVDQAHEQMRMVAEIRRTRTELTATGSVRHGMVTVTVNSDGTVIETRFADDIDDLEYADIARAVTEAAQRATAELARKNQELIAPLQQHRTRMPKLSDMIDGLPDFRAELGEPPKVSVAPPNSPTRNRGVAADASPSTGAETYDRENRRGGFVTDSSW
ncbi:YbaB/EbfC family nucleoid-associated protein [Nocardia sp. BMG111209]|uniref:YbaB/EbfC family nucleoid-associated protein n=1 Tax=Nocardia sp. BMG111209 TaxID=1160137 RepID=UPI000362CD07|nr:YbaB/EbfC family nucleoid-associated protein [Nocardia sp. BMG111209]